MRYILVALALLGVLSPLSGQTVRGTVSGNVTDEAGASVAGAAVELTHAETGRIRTTESSSNGSFLITMLPPGSYEIEVSSEGFRTYSQELTLLTGQEIEVQTPLLAGQRSDRVVVTAGRSTLKADSAARGNVLENHLVRGLPLDGRNFLELSLLLPGVAPSAEGSAASVRGQAAFNVNGAREDSNNYILDGIFNGDPKLNGVAVNPSVDAIQEFEVVQSTYDASFGRNAGSQVNVIVKSGSNDWHGTAYYFMRNAGLDARNFFAPPNEADPKYQRHQFGGSAGGPIRKNSTFFFADYEGLRLNEGVTRVTNVPTGAERRGDFSQSPNQPIDPVTGQPFPGGIIPSYYINQTGSNIANLYPLPNRDALFQNYASSPAIDENSNQFDVRVDQAIGDAGDLSIRYSLVDADFFNPFSGPAFPRVGGYGTSVPRRAQNVMLSEVHTFSPVWINEFRAGFNRVSSQTTHENAGNSLNAQVGLPEPSANQRDWGLALITLPGYSPLGDETNNPQASTTNTFQVADNVTHTRGEHLIKFGFDIRHTQQNAFRDVQSRGFLNFLGFTGDALADLLMGAPAVTGVAISDNPQYLRTTSYNLFVNDTWRLRRDLTLTFGVRYEYNSPPVDKFDRANVYDPETGQLVQVGANGLPRSGYEADKNNFAPRIGLAWRPGNGNTVLRGGYGIYFDQSSLAPGEGLFFSPPYFDFRLFYALPGLPLSIDDPYPENFPFPSPPSAISYQRDLRSPYVQHWSFSVQRQLGRNRVVEAAYVGSKGTKQLSARDINQPAPSPVSPNLRPNPFLADINQIESRSNSSYNALQFRFQQYLTDGLSFLASYTYSRSIDDASSFFTSAGDSNFPQDSYNVRAERGRSNFDVPHRLSLSYSWALPFGRGQRWLSNGGVAAALFGDWQTYGIWTFQSGRPFTVALLSELDNSNTGRSSLGFGANDRPHRIADGKLDNPTPERWFDTSAFTLPDFGTFGNSGRNILSGPDLHNINISLLRDFRLRESMALQFRAEAFNLFNRTNFDLPDIFYGSPTFGQVSSARSPRRIQFGLKLLF